MVDLPVVLLIIAVLLVLVSMIQPLAARLNVPNTVLLAAVGVVIGIGSGFLLRTELTDAFNDAAVVLLNFPINSQAFLYVFLPILLFQASLTIDVRRMAEDAAPILLLAVVAVLVTTVVVGAALWPLAGVSLVACLLLGSIVATTDPAAVVAIFRDLGAPSRLTRLVEGESLLNDAAAIAVFSVLLDFLVVGHEVDATYGAWIFVRSFGGGIAMGFLGARLMIRIMPMLRDLRLAEVTMTLALPYLVYVLSERYLDVSGVVAVVTAGLVVSAVGRSRISPETWEFLDGVWQQIAFWASSLVFILASMLVPKLLVDISFTDMILLAALIVAALAARALVLFGMLPLLIATGLGQRISLTFKLVILWGGLRGAVTLALALAVTENQMIDPEIQRFVAVMATGFVLFTLLVNGMTLRPMIRLLKLDRLSPIDQVLRRQVLALSLGHVRDAIQDAAKRYRIQPGLAYEIAEPYGQRMADASSEDDHDPDIADRDRITIGLVALADRERNLVLDHYRQRTISTRIVQVLLANVERMVDRARTGGRVEYNRAARRRLRFSRRFRIAHFLQRHFGIERPLVDQLADRFEILLVTRMVIEELQGFAQRKMKPILGPRVAGLVEEILSQRVEATDAALDALRLQYPEYAGALERQFLRRYALRLEDSEHRALFEEALIGQELYSDLQKELQARRIEAARRPRLDLGLHTKDLVKQFPMLSNLTVDQIDSVCRLLHPRFAVPGDRLIRRGDRGGAVFFISSGAVEVSVNGQKIRLGRGDIFGEMALLSGQRRRQADVVALGYCQLLILNETDFRRFLAANPAIGEQISQIAQARQQMNMEAEAE